jgi:hypothetical protein
MKLLRCRMLRSPEVAAFAAQGVILKGGVGHECQINTLAIAFDRDVTDCRMCDGLGEKFCTEGIEGG